ncbi:MAG: triose-phosphate isomerase, partial [Smithellaceae bacterium]|nr:triose-phosphate isomerase [Smithellaceae bacterium]
MRKPVIAGNWKMHKRIGESVELAAAISEAVGGTEEVTTIIAPPFTALRSVAEALKGSNIRLSGQNLHEAPQGQGAFTGEISAEMLLDAGCSHVIIGHSERRTLFAETDGRINAKIKTAIQYGMAPIFCLGETLAQREGNKAFPVIETQLKEGLKNISANDIGRVVIAYEPVWAIGTGKTASPAQAEEVHLHIRGFIEDQYGKESAEKILIIYGGSVNPGNIRTLMSQENIDGASGCRSSGFHDHIGVS